MQVKDGGTMNLRSIAEQISSVPCYSNEFLRKHALDLSIRYELSDDNCEVFWQCMQIYNAYGVDYFDDYCSLVVETFGNFRNGFNEWIDTRNKYSTTSCKDELGDLLRLLAFFEVDEYQGIPVEDFEDAYMRLEELQQICSTSKQELSCKEAKENLEKEIESYFNFGEFSASYFNTIVKDALLAPQKSLDIDALLQKAKYNPDNTYIVILRNGAQVTHIGKTANVLSYIGIHRKKANAEYAFVMKVENEYADDVIMYLKVHYEVGLETMRLTAYNRKYTTQRKAIRVYTKAGYKTRKEIIAAITRSKMMTVDLPNGQILVDKPLLHKTLYSD